MKSRLTERKVDMKYSKEKRSQSWIPCDAIEEILESEVGQKSFRKLPVDSTNKLLTFVSKSKCLWALLVHVNRLGWLESFYVAGFDDSLFPIRREENWKFQSCKSDTYAIVPGKTGDDETVFEFIEDQQWQFFVPVFRPENIAYEFDYSCRMPFIREFQTEETNFSAVTEVVIHRKHMEFPPNNQIVRGNTAYLNFSNEINANVSLIEGNRD